MVWQRASSNYRGLVLGRKRDGNWETKKQELVWKREKGKKAEVKISKQRMNHPTAAPAPLEPEWKSTRVKLHAARLLWLRGAHLDHRRSTTACISRASRLVGPFLLIIIMQRSILVPHASRRRHYHHCRYNYFCSIS